MSVASADPRAVQPRAEASARRAGTPRPLLWEALVVGLFAIVVLTMPFWIIWINGYQVLANHIVIWAMFALGFDILLGLTGYLSFGHAAFFGVAAYVAGLSFKLVSSDIIPAMIITGIALTIVGLFIGYLTLKRSGIYFSILTLAFGEMIHALVKSSALQQWTGGDNGLTDIPNRTLLGIRLEEDLVFILSAIILIVGFAAARQIKRSPFGLMLRAIKENPMRLEYTGVNVWRYKMAAYLISAMYAGMAGFLIVVLEGYVASEYLYWTTSGEVVIMSVIGGVGTLIGPMMGAFFLLYFENVVQAEIGEQWLLVLGLVFMFMVIFVPGGFADLIRKTWRGIDKRVRPRRHNVPDVEPSADRRAGEPRTGSV
ncbi:MAG: branched-chain amino acid ABC transporter permease [Rhizobiales bacterium]|nr:branched-chain amino acid ABC transporter permease [Hyphomicrobiales bacterium]